MALNPLPIALASIGLSVAAQFALKAGMAGAAARGSLAGPLGGAGVVLDRFVLLGFVLYGLGALVWLAVLARWDVSKAYPLVGLGFALTVAIGWLRGEDVTLLRLGGVALVCVGVACIARS